MLNYDLPVQSEIGVIKAFDDAVETAQTKRLKNYEAMQKMAKEFSDAGQEMTTEQWATVSKDVLGAAGWLNSTAPTADTVGVLMAKQKKDAAIKAELLRREQFKADQSEKTAMEADMLEQYQAGKSESDVYAHLVNMYGQDRADKVRPNMPMMQQKAVHAATMKGVEFGSKMFDSETDAEDYISKNKWHLSDYEIDGIRRGTLSNQSRIENEVLGKAQEMGTIGWLGDGNDKERMSAMINGRLPRASAEFREKLLAKAMTTAKANSVALLNAQQVKDNLEIARQQGLKGDEIALKGVEVELAEEQRLRQGQVTLQQELSARVAQQKDIASGYLDKGKAPKGMEPKAAARMHALLRSRVFNDIPALEEAVMKGDEKRIKELEEAAPTVAEVEARARGISELVTGKFNSVSEAAGAISNSGVLQSPQVIASAGKQIKLYRDIAQKNGQSVIGGEYYEEQPIINPETGQVVGTQTVRVDPRSGGSSEIGNTSAMQAETLEKNFITQSANEINGFREALRRNSHVGATAEEMRAVEMGLARRKAAALMSGMGITDPAMIDDMAKKIMDEAGPSPTLTRQQWPSERLKQAWELNRQQAANNPQTGIKPGTSTTSPRLNQNF